jgi:very-short-patch-repair endonuclease
MEKCKVCGLELRVISWKHLKYKHQMTIAEYDLQFGKSKHSTTLQTKESVEKANRTKKERNVEPWNKGLTKETNSTLKKMSGDRTGLNNPVYKIKDREAWLVNIAKGLEGYNSRRKNKTIEEYFGEEKAKRWKFSLSSSAKKRKIHGHTGKPHTEETKNLLRQKTIQRLSSLKDKTSKPQTKLYAALKEALDIPLELEYPFSYYALDIAMPSLKLCVEVDGDFWHVNEEKGYSVEYECQKRNKRIEKSKTTYLTNQGWKILRVWVSDLESDIDSVIQKVKNFIKENQ